MGMPLEEHGMWRVVSVVLFACGVMPVLWA